ncbi:MAG: DAK2 domain-containing protein, partial [Clostridia bacterium]|nr:DAK2 domain-containing protein [Clostridia bacterium]
VFPVPDGDTGDNMRMTIESGIAALEALESDDIAEVMKVLSHGMLLGARGNSGVILSQFFAGTSKGLEGVDKADPATFGRALQKGVEQAYASVMTPTEGTILTVAREAVEYAVSRITPKSTIRTLFADLAGEMNNSLSRTPEMLAALKEAGVVDSGGAGLYYIIDGFNRVLNGEEIESDAAKGEKKSAAFLATSFNADSEMTYGYCTEALLQLQNKKCEPDSFDVEALKAFLSEIGDSVVAFKTESIVKLHVHTLTPEKVLEHCRKYGEFLTVKIENMSVQHTELENGGKKEAPKAPEKPREKKKYGVVAVCNGEGIENIFRELGADEIIYGGQTHNPSTNEFLDAFDRVCAETVFVFPNNGNVLMAASQAAELYKKARIIVIPSKNIGTGYVGLSMADFSAERADDITAMMLDAMRGVISGCVSPSIRDASLNGVSIKRGDVIGIMGKEVVVSTRDTVKSATALAKRMLEGRYMLTLFCGKDSKDAETEEILRLIKEQRADAEVYTVPSGQDIYPYIFVCE